VRGVSGGLVRVLKDDAAFRGVGPSVTHLMLTGLLAPRIAACLHPNPRPLTSFACENVRRCSFSLHQAHTTQRRSAWGTCRRGGASCGRCFCTRSSAAPPSPAWFASPAPAPAAHPHASPGVPGSAGLGKAAHERCKRHLSAMQRWSMSALGAGRGWGTANARGVGMQGASGGLRRMCAERLCAPEHVRLRC
jgi:hypothetical protein